MAHRQLKAFLRAQAITEARFAEYEAAQAQLRQAEAEAVAEAEVGAEAVAEAEVGAAEAGASDKAAPKPKTKAKKSKVAKPPNVVAPTYTHSRSTLKALIDKRGGLKPVHPPHTSHLTLHSSRLTPHTSHLTPLTSHHRCP